IGSQVRVLVAEPSCEDRGIAQSGSAPALGAGCREFESPYPDHFFEHGSLAQLVEQLAFNQLVVGSNPTRPTTQNLSALLSLQFLSCFSGRMPAPETYCFSCQTAFITSRPHGTTLIKMQIYRVAITPAPLSPISHPKATGR